MSKVATVLKKANVVTYMICDQLIGINHTHIHRCAVGAVFMTVGVVIGQGSAGVGVPFVHSVGEGVGYLIHGIGTIPYAEGMVPLLAWLRKNM